MVNESEMNKLYQINLHNLMIKIGSLKDCIYRGSKQDPGVWMELQLCVKVEKKDYSPLNRITDIVVTYLN